MSNIFAIEPQLIQRISDAAPALKDVGSVSKLAGFLPDDIPLDSVYVVPGQGPGDDAGDPGEGGVQIVKENWLVIACVSHFNDVETDDTNTTAQRAGDIFNLILPAIVGWRPAGYLPFAYRGWIEPYYDTGYAEFPALFETGFVITGTL